jgi:hypothetical protein
VSLRLTTAFWNYDRTQALVDGRVKVEGCELAIELLRAEITFAKAFTEAPFDVWEISFSNTVRLPLDVFRQIQPENGFAFHSKNPSTGTMQRRFR